MAGLEGLLAGRVLGGRYLIEEVIGRGGMGAVYQALDERLGRRVAVKVITLAGDDPDAVERLRARFHREARAAAALPHHPNVVPVYDYGTDEALGLDYIVMELLRGQDLATRLARADTPPLSTGLRILIQAVRGVAVGHRSGLIHRDVKPGNLFLTRADTNETQVRVVDFGIAKLMDEEDTTGQLTQDGRVPHSPAFASPEQLRGLTNLTPAADVFSLGAVGYVLLTGRRPFTDSDRNRMSLGMAVPPQSLRSSHPAIPVGVEAVVLKALSFDAGDRYADAGAMLEALEKAIREISATPLEPYVAPAIADLGESPADSAPDQEDDDERTRLLPEDDHTQLLDEPPAGRPEMDEGTLAAPPPPPPPAAASPAGPVTEGVDPSSRAFPPRRPPEPPKKSRLGVVVWLLVLLALAAVGYWAYTIVSADQTAEIPPPPGELEGIGEQAGVDIPDEPDESNAYAINDSGRDDYNRRDYESAAERFAMAVEIDSSNAAFRRNLALALRHLGRGEEALRHLERAVRLDPTLLQAQLDLAGVYLALGDTTSAEEWFENFADRSIGNRDLIPLRNTAIDVLRAIRAARRAAAARADSAAADSLNTEPLDPDANALPPIPRPDSVVPVVPVGGD